MKRSMFQLFLNHCDEAIAFYQEAFGTTPSCIYRDEEDGRILHSEMVVFGQTIAFSENSAKADPGNTMMLCFHFGEGHEETIEKAYGVLKQSAVRIDSPPSPCSYSSCETALVDRYGVYWCLFI